MYRGVYEGGSGVDGDDGGGREEGDSSDRGECLDGGDVTDVNGRGCVRLTTPSSSLSPSSGWTLV